MSAADNTGALARSLADVATGVLDNHGLLDDLPESTLIRVCEELGVALRDATNDQIFTDANKLLDAAMSDHLRIVRELDVALNDVPSNKSLADLVVQVEAQSAVRIVNMSDGMRINFRAPDGRRATMFVSVVADSCGPIVGQAMRDAIAAYPVVGDPLPAACFCEECPRCIDAGVDDGNR